MKNKKLRLKSPSILALILAMSDSPALPNAEPDNSNPIFQWPPVEEGYEGDEDGRHEEQPLMDLDEMITALKMIEQYSF